MTFGDPRCNFNGQRLSQDKPVIGSDRARRRARVFEVGLIIGRCRFAGGTIADHTIPFIGISGDKIAG
jgi:hypothetical protein